MNWKPLLNEYRDHIKIERSLSSNTVEGYLHDLGRYRWFMEEKQAVKEPGKITQHQISEFIQFLAYDAFLNERSLARNMAAVRSFHSFLLREDFSKQNPSELFETPKFSQKLPVYLSIDEVESILAMADTSTALGLRNRAMLEVLYACGLRVSELVNLEQQNVYLSEGFMRVFGKGNKERLVPMGQSAKDYILLYKEQVRNHMEVKRGDEDILFLNRRGGRLTRNMVFLIVKELAELASIDKNVGPHTFRHSFATHLIEGGADLRAVQEMLGHESITTTEIYLHLDRDYLREVHRTFHPRG